MSFLYSTWAHFFRKSESGERGNLCMLKNQKMHLHINVCVGGCLFVTECVYISNNEADFN